MVRPLTGPATGTRRWPAVSILVRFMIAGLGGLAVNTLALSALYGLGHLTLPLASMGSSELAIIANYLINDSWTFPGNLPSWTRFARFNTVAVVGLGLAALCLWGLVKTLRMHFLLANVVALAASGLLTFGFSASWVWGRRAP
jgi:putative flippase GtrA